MGKKKKGGGPRKGKKKPRKTKRVKMGELYKKEKPQACPKCGPGVFMAKHKDRITCGKCSYTKWEREEKKEEVPEEKKEGALKEELKIEEVPAEKKEAPEKKEEKKE